MNRKSIKHFPKFLMLAAYFAAATCYAGVNIVNATVTQVRVDAISNGVFIYLLGGTYAVNSYGVTCVNPQNVTVERSYFIVKDDMVYKDILASALLAYSTGKPVTVVGSGTCTSAYSTTYDGLRYIQLK